MKQHITVNQMKEISDKELAKYMGLHFTHLLEAVCYYGADKPLGRGKLSEMSEMVTIGKMIEIISKKNQIVIETDTSPDNEWIVYIIGDGMFTPQKELVDILWSATKFVINNNR